MLTKTVRCAACGKDISPLSFKLWRPLKIDGKSGLFCEECYKNNGILPSDVKSEDKEANAKPVTRTIIRRSTYGRSKDGKKGKKGQKRK